MIADRISSITVDILANLELRSLIALSIYSVDRTPLLALPSVVSHVPPAPAIIPVDTTGTPLSTIIDQDAPSASTSPTTEETQASVIHQGVEEQIQGNQNAQFDNDPFHQKNYSRIEF
ncbi:hypothetical protein Tco_1047003 [Tanacetum coccineum]